jgi:hypothetical protein
MTRRTGALAVAVAAAIVLVLGLPSFSAASFLAGSSATATVRAAADWTPPAVSMADPGTPVKGQVTLAALASDAETGIASVTIQYLAPNAAIWVDVCTLTATPYSCAWDTRALTDGTYSLRARATDNAGYSTTSTVVSTTVANNVRVVMADPGDIVRGTVPLSGTLQEPGTTSWTVRFEYSAAGTTLWNPICSDGTAPYSCDWVTPSGPNGNYDLRAVALAGPVAEPSATVSGVLVDNKAPSVTMSDPGSPLSGTRTFAATVSDEHSGVARVVIQYAASGTSSFTDLCAVTQAPYSCQVNTATISNGTYSFRAVATDVAGNSATSAEVPDRVIQNSTETSYFLKTNSTGNTISSATLPLSTTAPTLTTLFNYDTNRDAVAGLLLAKTGQGLAETDATKSQRWNMSTVSPVTLSGNARVTLWSAMKSFEANKAGAVQVGLYDCNSTVSTCSLLGSNSITSSNWSPTGGWVSRDWDLGTLNHTVQAGRILQVRVVVLGSSGDDMNFAYDTTTYRSVLTMR